MIVPQPFTDFAHAFDRERYRPVPDDWWIAVSDVVDSTKAIAAGRYKDVNLTGAATIACVLNACGRDDLPFAFGGDGGVVLIPPEFRAVCEQSLRATQRMCREVIGLTLRCSLIPVAEIRTRGRELLVAMHDLGSGRLLAMLAGGGIEEAERLCKSPEGAPFAIAPGGGEPDLTGLSCRWEPLKPRHGTILAVVVHARDESSALPAIYRDLYARIASITTASPAWPGAYGIPWPPKRSRMEAALGGVKGRFLRRIHILFEGAAELISIKFNKTIGGFDGRAYLASLPRHSDYRKYSDSLRMVIDCTAAQADAIRALLDAEWKKGTIDYGTHAAHAALMTCFVKNTEEAGHVHFIDGADGGYALAAQDMKRRSA